MKPLIYATIGAILGIISGVYFKSISLFFFILIVLLMILLVGLIFYLSNKSLNNFIKNKFKNKMKNKIKNKFKKKNLIFFIIFYMLFFSYTIYIENRIDYISKILKDREVNIQASVVEKIKEEKFKVKYKIKIDKVYILEEKNSKDDNGINEKYEKAKIEVINKKINKKLNSNLILNIKKDKIKGVICSKNTNKSNTKILNLKYGDKICFKSKYIIPNGTRNEGGFDYKKYLKTQKVIGIVNCKTNDISIENNNNRKKQFNILKGIYSFKQDIILKIKRILPLEKAGVFNALLLGYKNDITDEIKENFKNSNLSHMLAISGAHVSYIILGLSFILTKSKIGKRNINIIVCIFLIFFIFLVGGSPSVVRASIMTMYILLGNLLYKKPNVYVGLSLSSLLILIINPYSLYDIGFQLSFGGTIGIILFNKKISETFSRINCKNKIYNYIKNIIVVSLSANIVITPIMMYHFQRISFSFLISNILASPIFAITLIACLIFLILIVFCYPIAKYISFIVNFLLNILIKTAKFSSLLPLSQVIVPRPSLIQIIMYYLIISVIVYPKILNNIRKIATRITKKIVNKNLKVIVVIFLIFNIFILQILKCIPYNGLEINMVDVGQGDCTFITTNTGKRILIDGGGSENIDVGEQTLLPFLLSKGILKIDYVMISHFDTDHCGGLFTILNNLKVKNVLISKQGEDSKNFQKFLDIIKKKKINLIVVQTGDLIKIDKYTNIEILFPMKDLIREKTLNNNSIVARLCWKNIKDKEFSILFTGDIEKIAEEKIVKEYSNTNVLRSDILKAPHHGSKSSSTEEFLNKVSPKYILIGVGKNNTFGHPSSNVIERYRIKKSKIFRTDLDGEIIIKIPNRKSKLKIDTLCK